MPAAYARVRCRCQLFALQSQRFGWREPGAGFIVSIFPAIRERGGGEISEINYS
jgi:hypothetical protein